MKPRVARWNAAAAISIVFPTEYAHLPVSTTHVTAGAIVGLATSILWAWILTRRLLYDASHGS